MTVVRTIYPLSVTLVSPFVTSSRNLGRYGVDISLARDWTGKKYIIPGTLVMGVIREIWKELAGENTVSDWMGPKALQKGEEDQFKEFRKDVHFSDLTYEIPDVGKSDNHVRICIDDATGAVQDGQLLVIESPFGAGKRCEFTGTLEVRGDQGKAEEVISEIEKTFCFIHALGRFKSIGFGKVPEDHIKINREGKKCISLDFNTEPNDGEKEWEGCFRFGFNFDRPFLVNSRIVGSNLWQGDSIIPGSVIKGAVYRALTDAGVPDAMGAELFTQAFSAMAFSHAFPSQAGNRARAVPLALVVERGALAHILRPEWIPSRSWEDGYPLLGQRDWKGETWVPIKNRFHWAPEPKLSSTTRTKIDERGKAEQDMLFVQRCVNPMPATGKGWWYGKVAMPDTNLAGGKELFRKVRSVLASGLHDIGKTAAKTNPVNLAKVEYPQVKIQDETMFVVVLQTPALMHSFDEIAKLIQHPNELAQTYYEYWRFAFYCGDVNVSDDPFEKFDFVAEQELAGGYPAIKYHRETTKTEVQSDADISGKVTELKDSAGDDGSDAAAGSGTGYYPFMLTRPGSTFFIIPKDEFRKQFEKFLEKAVKHGLPARGTKGWGDTDAWRTIPFVPENGYGEIRADGREWREFNGGVIL